jgi:B12-binding domain/radical SAM domain protein of rhizo-twelve system
MKLGLVNPRWSFEGSIYFGCREPHLPLELGYAKTLLEREGHDVLLVDATLGFVWHGDVARAGADIRGELDAFRPEATAITTAPSYLFWRCAQPELRVPMQTLDAVRDVAGVTIAVGPHASTTPHATLEKLRADLAIAGECEDVLATLARTPHPRWHELPSVVQRDDDSFTRNATDLKALPALRWPQLAVDLHGHHHHRFERPPEGAGAEIEASRGCPYHCTFCAKQNFRDAFRKRPLETILEELDALIAQGVRYVYFIDEIFVPDRRLLEAVEKRKIQFGVQMRIDNWSPPMLELLGRAGCVSIEGGMESITERGRSLLEKHCKLSTEELTELFIVAKKHVPFVQANLLAATDSKERVAEWRARLAAHGVWSNDPVPLFPYPGSPEYTVRFGACDDTAWERAHAHYLAEVEAFSDIQESKPLTLAELERR